MAKDIMVIPFDLKLDYEYWTYRDIISSILPEEEQDEIPVGFTKVGHVGTSIVNRSNQPTGTDAFSPQPTSIFVPRTSPTNRSSLRSFSTKIPLLKP